MLINAFMIRYVQFHYFVYKQVEIWQKVNREKLVEDLTAVLKRGITSLAVVLMHSYT